MRNKFSKIAYHLRSSIESGDYSDRLPSEAELAVQFSTTTMTIRKALEVLRKSGLIEKVPYVGSFVRREKARAVRILWPSSVFTAAVDTEIKTALQKHFTEFKLDFFYEQDVSPYGAWQNKNWDLMRVVATSSILYSEYAAPFPLEIIQKYRDSAWFQAPFETHRVNNHYYALPLLFSPGLLLFRKSLLKGFSREITPHAVTWGLLQELGKHAQQKNCRLWDKVTARILLRCLIFRDGKLLELNLAHLRAELEPIWHLFDQTLTGDNSVENVIVQWTCRQALKKSPLPPDEYFLATFPESAPGVPGPTMIAGEFMLLSNHSTMRQEATAVAEYLLSPEIQQIISKSKVGLPVLKAAALDSMDCRPYRDDLFISETQQIWAKNAGEQDFLLRLSAFMASISSGSMLFDDFINHLRYEMKMQINKREMQQPFCLEMVGL